MTSAPARRRISPLWLILVATSLPMFMASLDNLVMTNALPVLHLELGAGVEELQWFMNAYTLAFAAGILGAVALGDRLGRRTLFVAGIAVFTLASAAAAVSSDPGQLIAARAVQGLGGAAIMPLSLALLAGAVSPARRPLAIGIWGGVSGLGVATGPLIGGAVVEGLNWQSIFWINVPIGVLSVILAAVVLVNTRGARVAIDWAGLVLVAVGLLGVVYGIVRGNDAGWASAEVLGSLGVGVAALIGFVFWESRAAHPLLPLRLFRDRSFTVANVVGFAFSFGIFGAIFLLIQYLQIVQGASPFQAALQTSPWTLAPMVAAPVAGVLVPHLGTRFLIITGLVMEAVSLLWIVVLMPLDTGYTALVAPFVIAGLGMGLVIAPSATAVLATMAPDDHAKASGANSAIREVGVALGVAVLTAVFTGGGGELTPTGYVDPAIPAVLVGAAVLAVAAVIAFALPKRPGRVVGIPASETSGEARTESDLLVH